MFSSIVKVFVIVVVLFLGFVVFVYVGEAFANIFPNTIFTKWWRNNIVGRLPNNDIFF